MPKTIAPLGLKTAFLAAGLCVSMTALAQPAHNPATPLSTQAFRRANGDSLAIDMTSDGRYGLIYSISICHAPCHISHPRRDSTHGFRQDDYCSKS